MIFEFFIFIIICILYFFIYINMKINKNNEIYLLDQEPTRYNITKESYLKLPFYFNGTHLNQKINKKELILLEEKDKYYCSVLCHKSTYQFRFLILKIINL